MSVLFLTLPPEVQAPCVEKMSLHRLRDAMGMTLEPIVGLLRYTHCFRSTFIYLTTVAGFSRGYFTQLTLTSLQYWNGEHGSQGGLPTCS